MNGDPNGLSRDFVIKLIDDLDKALNERDIAVEKPKDFWDSLIDLAAKLIEELQLPIHQDPNVDIMWGIALLSTAWVGCISKSKLYSTHSERPQLTDEKRRNIDNWIRQLQPTIARIFLIGYELASKLRERRGQEKLHNLGKVKEEL